MNVTDIASNLYVAPPPSLQPQPAAAGVSGAHDSDPDRGGVHHHGGHHRGGHHRGGRMGDALMQALQSLGVSVPQANGATPASSSSAGNDADADDCSGGQGNGAASIKGDLRGFMHALFQAVRSESTTAGSNGSDSSSAAGADPRAGFSNGLSSLIAQVGNGSAPSDLQSAFDQWMSDLGHGNSTATAAANAGGTPAVAGSAGMAASVSLQQLLTQMQQNLGYGPASANASTGNLVGTSV